MVEIKVDQHQKGNSKMALSQNVKFPIFIWCKYVEKICDVNNPLIGSKFPGKDHLLFIENLEELSEKQNKIQLRLVYSIVVK